MPGETRRGVGIETLVDGGRASEETIDGYSSGDSGTGIGAGGGAGEGDPPPRPAGAPAAGIDRGGMVGRFVILGVLGAGGMGRVYSAYDPQLDRKVAIKLLRAAAVRGGEEAQTRLLREAQAMAKINHPSVVKVHEVGTHHGQVYVAMELVEGGTLRSWLAGKHTQREIIDVLVGAGRGLAAAHAAGLVHRDFKPDNVLIAKDGSVRVTDFGIVGVAGPPGAPQDAAPAAAPGSRPARATTLEELLSANTPLSRSLTRTGALMGTPAYMAPEQFGRAPVTARSDQFSFCVVLYEALYGERPFAWSNVQELAATVLAGRVSPPPPGARVPGWLRRVVLRGLSVDPGARHASMDALLAELTRDRVRRRRRILARAASVTALAAAGVALALRSGEGAACAAGEDRAAGVWSPARRAQMKAAFLASGRPHAAASFERLAAMLDEWSRSWALGYRDACEATRVRREQSEHLLDLRMACLGRRLAEADATIALLAAGGGDAVDHALEAAMALPVLAPCADTAALTAAVAPPETELARMQVQAVRGQLDEARGLERLGQYPAALAVARAALASARATAYRPVIAEALLIVGRTGSQLAEPVAIDALREAMHAAAAAGDDRAMIDAAAGLVGELAEQPGQLARAQDLAALIEAAAIHARPGPQLTVRLQSNLGFLDQARGRPAEARARYTATLALAERELGPEHPATLTVLTHLGKLATDEGRFADARTLYERALAVRERVAGEDHPDVARGLQNLGQVLRIEGKLDDAARMFERGLAIRIAALGPDHPEVGHSYNSLGALHANREDHAAAVGYFEKAMALAERAYGPDSVAITYAATNLATSLNALGKRDEAVALFERAIAIHEAAQGPDHLEVAGAVMNLGIVRQAQRRLDDALALYRRAARILEQAHGPDHPDLADALGNVATVLHEQHQLAEARAMTLRVLRIFERTFGAKHPRVGMALVNLGGIQLEDGDPAGALASYQRSAAIFEATLGPGHLFVSYALRGAAISLVRLRRAGEAIPLLERAARIRAAAGAPPVLPEELRSNLTDPLARDPRTRARELAGARAALAHYEKAGDVATAAELRRWLGRHR
jgi:eukaryotic-like serine/threonine-protein kinase